MHADIHEYTFFIDPSVSFFLINESLYFHSMSGVCWLPAAVSISTANPEAYFRTVFLSPLSTTAFVSPDHSRAQSVCSRRWGWIFFPFFCSDIKVLDRKFFFTATSTNEIPHTDCHLQIDTLTAYIFSAFFDIPHGFVFCSVRNVALLLARVERRWQTKIWICIHYSLDVRQPGVKCGNNNKNQSFAGS